LAAGVMLARDHGAAAATMGSLIFRAPPLIKRLVGRPAVSGMDVAYARLCLPWLAAVALAQGEVRLGDFTPERLGDPTLLALAQNITVEADDGDDPAAFVPLQAIFTSRSGARSHVLIDAMLGAPSHPLSREQHLEKARRCLAHAGLESVHAGLAEAIDRLDRSVDAGQALGLAVSGMRVDAAFPAA
jgi:2-methylcitrate dehydratase PrpD